MHTDPLNTTELELHQEIDTCLQKYREFLETNKFDPKIVKCLFTNTYNHFLSGKLLAGHGLIPQAYNCLRMGLESEWIGIILLKNEELGLNWAFGLGDETIKNQLNNLERPPMIRKIVGDNALIKIKDREEIYSALSDKSHTKLSSIALYYLPPGSTPEDENKGYIDCIPMGGIRGENNIARILQTVKTVMMFALADMEGCLEYRILDEGWTWNRSELAKISGMGSGNQQGKFEPFISSKGHPGQNPFQAIALLNAIRHNEI